MNTLIGIKKDLKALAECMKNNRFSKELISNLGDGEFTPKTILKRILVRCLPESVEDNRKNILRYVNYLDFTTMSTLPFCGGSQCLNAEDYITQDLLKARIIRIDPYSRVALKDTSAFYLVVIYNAVSVQCAPQNENKKSIIPETKQPDEKCVLNAGEWIYLIPKYIIFIENNDVDESYLLYLRRQGS